MSPPSTPPDVLRLAIPKGRMNSGVTLLMADAGIHVSSDERGYRPRVALPGVETKLLKPQNVVEMLHSGSRDLGFAGADWVAELDAKLVELLDTGLDPVQLVAAAPASLVARAWPPPHTLVIASEYERLATLWISGQGLTARFVRSYGATEVFPPEDADCIIDNTATGATLAANGLVIVDELMRSSTRLFASPRALEHPARRAIIDDFVLLLSSVLEARRRVMVEVNVSADRLEAVVAVMPCMREPTISPLHGAAGYAVKAAVLRERLPALIPEIRARGGTDIVVTRLAQILP